MQSTTTISGNFEIQDWQESTISELSEGGKITSAKVKQSYQGDIVGQSQLEYQMHYQTNGTAVFIGYEVITGTFNSTQCEIVLQHKGKFENGQASSQFEVVHCPHAENLLGAEGSFNSTEGRQADYQINLP